MFQVGSWTHSNSKYIIRASNPTTSGSSEQQHEMKHKKAESVSKTNAESMVKDTPKWHVNKGNREVNASKAADYPGILTLFELA